MDNIEESTDKSWFVVQTMTGQEQTLLTLCERMFPEEEQTEWFLPTRQLKIRRTGVWQMKTSILFPGYLFVTSDDVEKLFFWLKQVPRLTKLLRGDDMFLRLSDADVSLLRKLGGEQHVAQVSTGILVGSQIRVLEGPLQGMEGSIKRIDRHKRLATVELMLFGQCTRVQLALEVTEKIDAE